MRFYWLVIGILAVWRIAHLLYGEDGPWDAFVRLRLFAGESFLGSLMDCFYCLSLWVAMPIAFWFGENWKERLLLWPALSAGAILLNKLMAEDEAPALTGHKKVKGGIDNVLWQQEGTTEDGSRERSGVAK